MEKKQNKTPLVRFPEFKEDWKFINGNELFKTISNKDHNSDLPILAISQEFGAIPRELINYNISVTNKSVSSYKVIEVGDFIISLRSFEGGIEYSNYKGICSPAYIILRPTVKLERNFYRVHFKTFRYIQQLQSKLEGIRDGKMISYKYFSEIKLPFPTLPEQQKIAHFFTTLDKKIDQLQEKKNALEEYKKVMMQKLFSQELRFKDEKGKDYPDWDEKKLGEVSANIMYGMNASSTTFDGKNKYLRITDIDENTRTYIPNPITSPQGIIEDKYKLSEGDIVFTRTGASVGKSYLYDKKEGDLFFAGFLIRFAIKKGNPNFIYYQTLTEKYNKWVITMSMRSGQPGLNANEYKEFEIVFPSIHEQNKIANFLSKIDEKINTVNEQIKQTKTYKKGLLQKMFV